MGRSSVEFNLLSTWFPTGDNTRVGLTLKFGFCAKPACGTKSIPQATNTQQQMSCATDEITP